MFAEHNPFGEYDEDVKVSKANQNSTDVEKMATAVSDYDTSLNPFADDDDDTPTSHPVKPSDAPAKKKLVPLNPFEVSDDEEEPRQEIIHRKKIVPDVESSAEKPKNTHAMRQSKLIVLPDTSGKKVTPKKKAPAPPTSTATPPTLAAPLSSQTSRSASPVPPKTAPTTNVSLENKENKQSNPQQSDNEKTPSVKLFEGDNSQFIEAEEEDNTDAQKRKHRPAPPRPMPPKRRVRMSLRPRSLLCTSCLSSKATAAESKANPRNRSMLN